MADHASRGGDRAEAAARVGRWLEANFGARAIVRRELPPGSTSAWGLALPIAGRSVELLYSVDERRRGLAPRVGMAASPPFPCYPHVEPDGRVCVLNPVDEVDPDRPAEVARELITRAADVIEKGVLGTNEDDFRTEFLSYWNPTTTGEPVLSLLDPSGPSRLVAARRDRSRTLVAENGAELRRWLRNAGRRSVPDGELERALLVWLPRPMLPADYPRSVEQLRAVASCGEEPADGLLNRIITTRTKSPLVLIGAPTRDGVCFAAVRISHRPPRASPSASMRVPRRRIRTPGPGPDAHLIRSAVDRADPFWIHGRDGNVDLPDLRMATVGIVGCGSLGGPVARYLALAGVGRLGLVDPDALSWGNVGRHVLGGEAVGMNKADAMAIRLGREFPHGNFEAHSGRWQIHRDTLARCDLLVSTIGGWGEEAELDEWRIATGGPPTVYGWSEPRACAGHAVLVDRADGCLACGFDRTGGAAATVTDWPAGQLRREPACGAFFQPYGAVEIGAIAGLVAALALDRILDRARPRAHRMLSVSEAMLQAAGGAWSSAWLDACGDGPRGGVAIEREWPKVTGCAMCGGRRPA
jgi:hypothetical protein